MSLNPVVVPGPGSGLPAPVGGSHLTACPIVTPEEVSKEGVLS